MSFSRGLKLGDGPSPSNGDDALLTRVPPDHDIPVQDDGAVRLYLLPHPRILELSGITQVDKNLIIYLDQNDQDNKEGKWAQIIEIIETLSKSEVKLKIEVETAYMDFLRRQGDLATKLAEKVEVVNNLIHDSLKFPITLKIGYGNSPTQADIILTFPVERNFLRTVRLKPHIRTIYDIDHQQKQNITDLPIFIDATLRADDIAQMITSLRKELQTDHYFEGFGHPLEDIENFLNAERLNLNRQPTTKNRPIAVITIPYHYSPHNTLRFLNMIGQQHWIGGQGKRFEFFGKNSRTYFGVAAHLANTIYRLIPHDRISETPYDAVIAVGQETYVALPPEISTGSTTLICPTGSSFSSVQTTLQEILLLTSIRSRNISPAQSHGVVSNVLPEIAPEYDTDQIVPLDEKILGISDEFLVPLHERYARAAHVLLGLDLVRPLKEYKGFAKAAQIIVPRPKFKALLNPDHFKEYYKNLIEIIVLLCMIDVGADDIAENADTSQKKEFMDIYFDALDQYFAFHLLQDVPFHNKESIQEKFQQKITQTGLPNKEGHIQYLEHAFYCIDEQIKRISSLPNFKNGSARNIAYLHIREMLEACRFSRRYGDLVTTEDQDKLCKETPTLTEFLQKTAGGMAMGFMVAIGSMLLKPEYAENYLRLAPLVSFPGRVANDFVWKKEVSFGQANAFGFLSWLSGSRKEWELHKKFIALSPGEEKNKLFEELGNHIGHHSRIDQMLIEFQSAMSKIKMSIFHPDLNIESQVHQLYIFLQMELSRCPYNFQNMVKERIKALQII